MRKYKICADFYNFDSNLTFFRFSSSFFTKIQPIFFYLFQDHFNVLHIAAMYSREDVVKLLLNKRGVDPFSTGGVSIFRIDIHCLMKTKHFGT